MIRPVNSDREIDDYLKAKRIEDIKNKVVVPAGDDDVRRQLRQLGLPAELPEESKSDRRHRLITFIAEQNLERSSTDDSELIDETGADYSVVKTEEWTEAASPALVDIRHRVSKYTQEIKASANAATLGSGSDSDVSSINLSSSQTGFSRPVTAVSFYSPDIVAVGDAGGELKVLKLDEFMSTICTASADVSGSRICDIKTVEERSLIITGNTAGDIHLRTFNGSTLETRCKLNSSASRIGGLDVHTSANALISGSYDRSWHMWDLQTEQCLLSQDGHTDGIRCIQLNSEKCLLSTGSLDKVARIWDLRNGLPVCVLSNHCREVQSVAWNEQISKPYELFTAGADNRCLLWDLRNPASPVKTIYAHTNTVTGLLYDGSHLISGSLDGSVKIWNANNDFELSRKHESGTKIMSLAGTSGRLLTGRWDRQIDLYV